MVPALCQGIYLGVILPPGFVSSVSQFLDVTLGRSISPNWILCLYTEMILASSEWN